MPAFRESASRRFKFTRQKFTRQIHACRNLRVDLLLTHPSLASPGETSVINIEGGNDYANGYLFYALDSPELKAQLGAGAWRGGINISAYAAAEQRSYGFYHWFKLNGSDATPYLTLNATHTGTSTGLSKMPYLRDTRRSSRVGPPFPSSFVHVSHFAS